MRRLLIAALLLGLAAPASASAGASERARFAPMPLDRQQHTARASESLRIAREFWGAGPTDCGQDARVFAIRHADLLVASGNPAAYAITDTCDIWVLDTELADNHYARRIQTCTAVVHEWGHMLGLYTDGTHSTDERSVMVSATLFTRVVYACYKRFMPKGKAREWRGLNGGPPLWFGR